MSIEHIESSTVDHVVSKKPGKAHLASLRADKRTFRNGQRWRPLVSQNVQADGAVGVDIRVVDAGGEVDLGRLEGVVCGKVDGEEKDAALEWRVALWSWR